MVSDEYSLDKVLAAANEQMREFAPDDAPEPPVETGLRYEPDGTISVPIKHLVALYGFAAGAGSILSGQVHPADLVVLLANLGFGANELRAALADVRPKLHGHITGEM